MPSAYCPTSLYWKAKLKPVAASIDYLINHGNEMEAYTGTDFGARLGTMMRGVLQKSGVEDAFMTIMAH